MKDRTRKGFDFLAPFYEWGLRLFFGNSVFRSQVFFISLFSRPKSVLILGGGSGRLLRTLILESKPEYICYIDISEKMILQAREWIEREATLYLPRIDFICGSIADLPVHQTFDLILTPYVLDCMTDAELEKVLKTLNETLIPGGFWLLSDFNIPEKGFYRILAQLITRILYLFFNLVCGLGVWRLPDFDSAINKMDMRKVESEYFLGGLLSSKVYVRK